MLPRLASNSQLSSCLSFPSSDITDISHHIGLLDFKYNVDPKIWLAEKASTRHCSLPARGGVSNEKVRVPLKSSAN